MLTDTARNPKRAAIIVVTLSCFIIPFMASSLNVALPSIGPEFAMGLILLGWINNAYLMACLTFMIPFGRLGDIYGCKKIFTRGYFCSSCRFVANCHFPVQYDGYYLSRLAGFRFRYDCRHEHPDDDIGCPSQRTRPCSRYHYSRRLFRSIHRTVSGWHHHPASRLAIYLLAYNST